MATQYEAIIRHDDGTTTPVEIVTKSELANRAPWERPYQWGALLPSGHGQQTGDEFVTDLPEGTYELLTPIENVMPR